MAEFSQGLDLAKKSSEKSKILPRYHLTRRADLSLAFDPPIGSRELANALSMKYPLCGSLEQQLQSAILDFIHTEPDESQQHTFTTPQDRRQSLSPVKDSGITDKSNTPNTVKPAHANDFEASTSVWNAITGDPVVSVEKKRKRIKYDRVKRSKVAGVRRSGACDFHRKKKTECTCNNSPVSGTNPIYRRRSHPGSMDAPMQNTSFQLGFPEHAAASETQLSITDTYGTASFTSNVPQRYEVNFESNFAFGSTIELSPALNQSTPRSSMSLSETSQLDFAPSIDDWAFESLDQPNNFW